MMLLDEHQPTCDVCGAIDELVDWCGSCGCCIEHCQRYWDCPVYTVDDDALTLFLMDL